VSRPAPKLTREALEELYRRTNRRELVSPDPIEFLYRYDGLDREVAGLVASSLAYGRVAQILRSVGKALALMGPPAGFATALPPAEMRRRLRGFKHRFTTGADLARLLAGAGRCIMAHGSLGRCFARHVARSAENIIPAAAAFVEEISRAAGGGLGSLLPSPERGSACKRLNLYLRWMVRKDAVDPGGWPVSPRVLLVPLDVHMHRICRAAGLTSRRQCDLRTAVEATRAFALFEPGDPVKYDFALTRAGINPASGAGEFLSECGIEWAA